MIVLRQMLWLGLWAILVLATSTGAVLAERVGVRSGEHDGYTRLVLDLPRDLRWDMQTTGAEAQLTLDGISADFDLSDAFRRLSSGRIAGLTPISGKSTLRVSLGCACKVEVFRLGDQMLVVDIRGEPGTSTPPPPNVQKPAALAAAPKPIARPARKKADQRYYFPFEVTASDRQNGLSFGTFSSPLPATSGQNTRLVKSGEAAATPVISNQPLRPLTPDGLDRTKRVAEAEKRLAKQLSRAASQGLVTPRAARLPKPPPPQTNTSGTGVINASNPPDASADQMPKQPGINLRAQTSADRAFIKLLGAIPQNSNGERCFSDEELDVAGWATEAPFGKQVGALRANLVGEFDRPNAPAARNLIRLYIHFGFGVEALHVLKTSALSGDGVMLLKSMAEIMEYGHTRAPGPLANQFDCDTHAALWAVLAHADLPQSAQPNGPAILRSVGGLPPQIRGYLGPKLSQRLVSAGFEDLAGEVLHLVERGQDGPDARFNMADAGLHLAEGNVTEAAAALDTVVVANTDLSPKALVTLVDTRLANDLPLDIQTADLAGAYAHEYRKDPLGAELKRVHILALSEAGAYDAAFDELRLFSAHATATVTRGIRSHAMAALAHDAGDVTFLKYALDTHEPESVALEPSSANAIADRLISLRFPAQADTYLRPVAEGVDGRDRRLLRARAALDQRKPRRAEADLLGLSGPEADLLRAEARSLTGDHATAQRLFAELERDEDMISEAWLAADWAALQQTGDPLWQRAAAMATVPTPPEPSGQPGGLAKNRALIDASSASRNTIAELLSRMPVDTPPSAPD